MIESGIGDLSEKKSQWTAVLLTLLAAAVAVVFVHLKFLRRSRPNPTLLHVLPANFSDFSLAPLAFSPDEQFLAFVESGGRIKVVRVTDGKLVKVFHASPNYLPVQRTFGLCLAFSPDGQILAVGCADDVVRVFKLADGKVKAQLGKPVPSGFGSGVHSLAFSPDGKFLAIGIHGKVIIWRVNDQKQVKILQSPHNSIAFSSDGKWFAAGGSKGVNLWRVNDWQPVRRFPVNGCIELVFNGGGRLLTVLRFSGQAEVWDIAKGSRVSLVQLSNRFPRDAAFLPNGNLVAVTDIQWSQWVAWLRGQSLKLRLPKTLNPFSRLEPFRSGVTIWHLPSGDRIARLMRGVGGLPIGVAFSPKGKFVAVGYAPDSVAIWELE